MRKLNVGDKVRFLNSVGGGTVKGFVNKEVVIIEDKHGFDIPTLAKECIVFESNQQAALKQTEITEAVKDNTPHTPILTVQDDKTYETPEGENITTCIAFLPLDEKNISTTSFEAYFINDSNYYLFINYMNRENNTWQTRFNGIVEPNTQLFIEEFSKQQLNEIEHISVQFVAFKHNKPFKFKNPTSVELKVDTVKFYKLHSFVENDYFDDNALLYYITRNDLTNESNIAPTEYLKQALLEKTTADRKPRVKRIEKKKQSQLLEIDLHIDQLLDSTAGMDNAAMLDYQLTKFHEVMNDNIKRKGQKIVFIHGKGDGVLKSELIKSLKSNYKKCYYQDASFKEYGFGATMVTIK